MRVIIDNDVIIKIAAYGLGEAFTSTTTVDGTPPAMLSVGRFVVRDRLLRTHQLSNNAAALAYFEVFLPELLMIEPTEEEIRIAADFETSATKANLELDGGESQLLAVLLIRAADLLITGDKRAIAAIASIVGGSVQGRLACFEQLIATLVGETGVDAVREAVCAEPLADRAITICCSCTSATVPTLADLLDAIKSYTSHVRRSAAGALFCDDDLSALAA